MTSWWDNALGNTPPAAPAAPTHPPTTIPPPLNWQRQMTEPVPEFPLIPEPAPTPAVVTKDNLADALRDGSRYEGIKRRSVTAGETATCPDCGSGNYFSNRRNSLGAAARAHCFECGYPVSQGNGA